jgi:hypothetical protein
MGDHTWPRKPSDERPGWVSDATRHLCAAAYLDRKFRDLVIRKVYSDAHHRVAPSSGFNLIPVLRHAWRARIIDDVHHACLVTVLILGYLTDRPAAITAVCAIGLWYVTSHAPC